MGFPGGSVVKNPPANANGSVLLMDINDPERAGRNYSAQVAIVKEMAGRNRAAQLAIVKQMSRH